MPWFLLIFFSSNTSCCVGGHWRSWLDKLSWISSLTAFGQFSMNKLLSIPPPSKTLDQQFGKTETSDDMTNSNALVKEKLLGFKNLSFCLNFSFSLFFRPNFLNFLNWLNFLRCFGESYAAILKYIFHPHRLYGIELT